MTDHIADDAEYIAARMKEIAAEKTRAQAEGTRRRSKRRPTGRNNRNRSRSSLRRVCRITGTRCGWRRFDSGVSLENRDDRDQ